MTWIDKVHSMYTQIRFHLLNIRGINTYLEGGFLTLAGLVQAYFGNLGLLL